MKRIFSPRPRSVVVVFGLPASGKSYVGEVLKDRFGYFVYEADRDLPTDMKRALLISHTVTDEMRDRFFSKVVARIKSLRSKYKKLVVTQTFIREKYREKVLKEFPGAKFILVKAKVSTRQRRLKNEKRFPLKVDYVRKMNELFETPGLEYSSISNEIEGPDYLKKQLTEVLQI